MGVHARLLWATLIFEQKCSICSEKNWLKMKQTKKIAQNVELNERTNEYYIHENDKLDIATKSLLSFHLSISRSVYAQWIGRFSRWFEYCKIVSVIEMKLRMYKWWLYVINFFLIGFEFFFFCFFSLYYCGVCEREWPNFICIEFYLLKDIKRISIFTVLWCWLFLAFIHAFFRLFICFANFALRIMKCSQIKNEIVQFTFFSWIFDFLFTFVWACIHSHRVNSIFFSRWFY